MKFSFVSLCLSFFLAFLFGCYSFSGISIDPNTRTYYVPNFKNNAINAVPGLELEFTEALKDKINRETRLAYNDVNPDIEFVGTLVDYRISSEAPRPGETVSLNRLTIVLAIDYIDNQDQKKSWKSNFSFFSNFDATQDITSIQEDLIQEIRTQLMEDIFNKAFTAW